MLQKILSISFIFLLFNIGYGQLDDAYFQRLQTERITSSESLGWKPFGPGMSGYCESFWTHPTDSNCMYMSPDLGNSYTTKDDGRSWQTFKDPDGSGRQLSNIRAMDFSRQNPDLGFAVRSDLFKTTNKGVSWEKVNFPGRFRYSAIAVDPQNDNNWYIGAGNFWNVKKNLRTVNQKNGITNAPFVAYGHIYRTTNKGRTWRRIATGLPNTLSVGRIIVDPRDSNIVIMATNHGIYKSTDQGNSWTSSGTGLPNNLSRDMTSYYNAAANEFILYTVDQSMYEADGTSIKVTGGIYKSIDSGTTWTSITGNLAIDLTQISDGEIRNRYFQVVERWLEIPRGQGRIRYPTLPTSIHSIFNRISVNPLNKDEIYISHNIRNAIAFPPGDVWKTTDGGLNWIACTRTGTYWSNERDRNYWISRNNPLGMNTSFAHLQREKSTQTEKSGNRFMSINSKGEVFICVDQQILRSNNNGDTWEQIDDDETQPGSKHWVGRGGSNLPGRFMTLETGIPGRHFFCSGEHGLWETASIDGFRDPTAIAVKQIDGQVSHDGATSPSIMSVHPTNPQILFMLVFRQRHRGLLRKSINGGQDWFTAGDALNIDPRDRLSDRIHQQSLIIDYNNDNNIYLSTASRTLIEVLGPKATFTDFGVRKSEDGGVTWENRNNGFPTGANVRKIQIHPTEPLTLYAALSEGRNSELGGLYKTVDGAASWTQITIPSEIKAVNNVFIDRNNNHLFISCGRERGTLIEGGVWRSKNDGVTWEKIFDMPYVVQTETSPINPDIIVVSASVPHEFRGATNFNPGAYLSKDAGLTWTKINKGIGSPQFIFDLKPDPVDENVFWCSNSHAGYFRGVFISDPTLGINDLDINSTKETIKLFPNPAFNAFEINFNSTTPTAIKVDVFDLLGRKVLTQNYNESNKIDIQTSQLITGTYIIKIYIGSKEYIKRFVKK